MTEELSLIDTDILSYILKKMQPAYSQSQRYLQTYKQIKISSLTYYESLRGYKASGATRRMQIFQKFLHRTEILDVEAWFGEGKIRVTNGERVGLKDGIEKRTKG